jgi:hypothetical protein
LIKYLLNPFEHKDPTNPFIKDYFSVGFKIVNGKKKVLSNEDKKIIKEIGFNVE